MRAEFPKDYPISSSMYVAAVLRKPERREDHTLQKVIYRKPDNCNHCSTVCIVCWYMWNQDYELLFDRTVAGRRLWDEKISPLDNPSGASVE